ncbi:MAG: DNA mismatch repair endonuclease MutL [Anaerolineales bacterium]|jgi:DNA mismatch repair protein MutL
MAIHLLPPEVAAQIAAGEVVERPASVVKELVENALDAGARNITIQVEGAGTRLIRVTDDGSGIPPAEIPLTVERHATSKLSTAADLSRIATLGFRGEALASIAAVSRLKLISRPASEERGASISVDGGRATPPKLTGAPPGTSVTVEDLFFSVPARRKFLKSEQTERRQIDLLVCRYALAFSEVRFRLAQEGREVLRTSGSGDPREALAAVFGVDVARSMLALQPLSATSLVSVEGFVSPPSRSHSNRRDILLFVNRRWIQDGALTTAVVQAYHTLLMVGRYPLAALFLSLSPEEVDVNVHPAKNEVRFRNPNAVFAAVQKTLRQNLIRFAPVAGMAEPGTGAPWARGEHGDRPVSPDWHFLEPGPFLPSLTEKGKITPAFAPAWPRQDPSALASVPPLRVLGQVGATYIVAEGPDGLYLIDQHAAHERVLYEGMMRNLGAEGFAQSLLQPVLIELPAPSAQLIRDEMTSLQRIGFDIEAFGERAFRIRAIPPALQRLGAEEAIRAVLEDLEEEEPPLAQGREARLIARVCKRAAVKGGQALPVDEQEALLKKLEECESPRTCPHGRPTMIRLSVDLLERQFGRRG